jgi:uncharacterized membrane protein YedE/YeeE
MNKIENIVGIIGLIAVVLLGNAFLATDALFIRLLIGIAIGYCLSRAYSGFAGSVNRAYNTGSTKLMRSMMLMFFVTALVTSSFVLLNGTDNYNLWINPINLGLVLGALSFGFGMSLSSCCASGVLTDLVSGLPRALVTLLFFGMGVFIGFPIQRTSSIVQNSIATTAVGASKQGGVYIPDLFGGGVQGTIFALILVGFLCLLVTVIAYNYERKRKQNGTFTGVGSEKACEQAYEFSSKDSKFFSKENYNRLVAKPWSLTQGSIALVFIFVVMMGVYRAGWGASTPYGIWFGKLVMLFGVSADQLASFTKMNPSTFTTPFFENQITVQNVGIVFGTLFYLLSAGVLKKMFFSEMHITFKEVLVFALGGITMGFGTRLANGCNVGALYTPIANLSLSGWVFLVFMIVGGIAGSTFAKKIN